MQLRSLVQYKDRLSRDRTLLTKICLHNGLGNMGKDAHPKNPGSYIDNQWMKHFELDSWLNIHRILGIQTSSL